MAGDLVPEHPRAFEARDWEEEARDATHTGDTQYGLLASAWGALTGAELPGGIAKFRMSRDVGGSIYRNVRIEDGEELARRPFPEATTIGALWRHTTSKFSDRKCMGAREILEMTKDGNKEAFTLAPFSWITYAEAYERSNSFGRGLAALGVKQNDIVNFYAETKMEWQLASQGCYEFGFTVSTTYANLGAEALKYSIHQTESEVVFTDADLVHTVCKVLGDCPTVKHVVFVSDRRPANHEACKSDDKLREQINGVSGSKAQAHSFDDVLEQGRQNDSIKVPESIEPDSTAMIMYTSGSTGNPKGVVISHANSIASTTGAGMSIPGLGQEDEPQDAYLAYLPLAHILEVTAENAILASGGCIGYGSAKTLTDNSPCVAKGCNGDAKELRPTLMAAVPLIMDKIRSAVNDKVHQAGGVIGKLFDRGFRAKLEGLKTGKGAPFWDWLVFDRLRTRLLGGRVRYMLSGGGPLSKETQEFMNVVFCCPVGQGYGLTETVGIATTLWPNDRNTGRVGAPVPSAQIKLVDWEEGGYFSNPADSSDEDQTNPRGEIHVGGPHIAQGYFKEEEKTKEAFYTDDDGVRWMRTGDIGEMYPDGVLAVIDRKKDLVKMSHGEYLSLGKLESFLRDSKYVDNGMVYGNSNESYCVAVISRVQEGSHAKAEEDTILDDIHRIMKQHGCAKFELPKKLIVTDEEWGPHNDLTTAALKLKRQNLLKKYKDDLEELYE